MAKTKLSELLKTANVKLEDLEDDEAGMTLVDLRKSLKENQAGFTKATQKTAELEKQLTETAQQAQAMQQQLQQWEQYRQQVQAQTEQARAQAGGEWQKDAYLQPIAVEFQRVTEINRGLANAYALLLQQYHQDRQALLSWANEMDVRDMKRRYADYDEEKVQAIAKQHGLQGRESAYKVWKGETAEASMEERIKQAKAEGMREAEEKLKAPATEMGQGSPGGGPAAGEDKPLPYDQAWKELIGPMTELGRIG